MYPSAWWGKNKGDIHFRFEAILLPLNLIYVCVCLCLLARKPDVQKKVLFFDHFFYITTFSENQSVASILFLHNRKYLWWKLCSDTHKHDDDFLLIAFHHKRKHFWFSGSCYTLTRYITCCKALAECFAVPTLLRIVQGCTHYSKNVSVSLPKWHHHVEMKLN